MSFQNAFFDELTKIAGDDKYIKRKPMQGPSGFTPGSVLEQERSFRRMSRPVSSGRAVGSLSQPTSASARRPAPKLVPR